MTKRIITVIISLCLAAGLLAVPVSTAQAATSGKCGDDITWEVSGDLSTLSITGSGPMWEFEQVTDVPWMHYTPYGWPDNPFTRIVISGDITSISAYSFMNSKNLLSVELPDSVRYIGAGAFTTCRELPSIKLPSKLEIIDGEAFSGCNKLRDVKLPSGLKIIGPKAFSSTSIETLTIPDSVTEIYADAFSTCEKLKSVSLPDGLEYLPSGVFENCIKLTTVKLPEGLRYIDEKAFRCCESLTEIEIPDGTVRIAGMAFESSGLKTVNLPDSVLFLGAFAFYDTPWFDEQPDGPVYAGKVFCKYKGNCEDLVIKDGTLAIAEQAFWSADLEGTITLPDGLLVINDRGLELSKCTGVKLGKGLAYLGSHAISYINTDELILPETLSHIGYSAFYGSLIENLYLTCTDAEIDDNAFQGLHATTVHYIPGSGYEENSYGGYNINWKPVEPVSISVETVKTEYFRFSEINRLTLDIEVELANCSFELDPYYASISCDTSSAGNTTAYVEFAGATGSFEVTVTENEDAEKYFGTENLIRSAGQNRYETAIMTADTLKRMRGVDRFDTIIVASGDNFPDALAGSCLACKKGAPILMVGKKGKALDTVCEYIKNNLSGNGKIYILGGTSAVPADADELFLQYTDDVVRLAGANRYETNLLILDEAGVGEGEDLLVANALNFADALSASALGKPILLTNQKSGKLTDAQKNFLTSHSFNEVYILGGNGAVPASVESEINKICNDGKAIRLSGSDRYVTSFVIATTFFDDCRFMTMATGKNYPDGLTGGVLAAEINAPLLLVSETHFEAALSYSLLSGVEKNIVYGGSASVSEDLVDLIRGK